MLIGIVRRRAVIWGRTAGLVAFVGLINLSGLLLVDWFAIALGQSGLPVADAVGILERPRRIALCRRTVICGLENAQDGRRRVGRKRAHVAASAHVLAAVPPP